MLINKSVKIGKRALSLVLALCMTIVLLSTGAAAAVAEVRDKLQFEATIEFHTFGTGIKGTYYETKLKILYTEGDATATAYFTRVPATKGEPALIEKYNALPAEGVAVFTVKVDRELGYQYEMRDPQWQGEQYIAYITADGYDKYPSLIFTPRPNKVSGDSFMMSLGTKDRKMGSTYWFGGTRTVLTDEKYIFGEDSFSFANSSSNFFIKASNDTAGPGMTYSASNGYQLSPKYYKMLIDGLSSSEIAAINSVMNNAFFGNCFGMSAVSALLYAGDLKLSQIETGAANTYALKAPVQNPALRDAIYYYQLMQKTYAVNDFLGDITNTSSENASELVSSLRSHLPEPVLIFLRGSDWAHAMLAYDMEKKETGYKIMVYDPNYPKKPLTMTISSDYSKITYDNNKYNDSYLGLNVPLSTGILKNKKFQEALEPFTMPKMPENSATIKSSTDTLTIKSGSESAVFENGKKTSGTLDVKYLGPVNEIDQGKEVVFFINPPKTRTEPWYTTIYSGPGTRISYSKSSEKGYDGVFIKVDSDEKSEIHIEHKTNTTRVNSKGGRFKVSVASDKTKGELFATTVEGSGTEVTITPSATGAAVTTTDNKPVDITVSSPIDYVTFDDIDCKDGITVDNSGSTSTLKDADGNKVATGDASVSEGKATVTSDPSDNDGKTTGGGNKTGTTSVSFSDVPDNSWYAVNVRAVAEANIINGKGNGAFAPNDNVTLAEVVKLAAAVHAKLTARSYDFTGGNPWYQPYLDYLDETESFPVLTGYNFNAPANRELFANIMAGVLSAMSESERSRNSIADNAIPDIPRSDVSIGIYSLYRAGIVAGSDTKGTFNPYSNIKRSEVAAIIHRFIDASQRKSITLTAGGAQKSPAASADNGDMTGYIPEGWSWKADSSQGYGLNTFTFGKYVRSDGSAVLYICAADDPLRFKYYLYAMPDGAKSSAYTHVSTGTLTSSAKAVDKTEAINFTADGEHITVSTSWATAKYMQSGTPDGEYTLVKGLN